MISKDYINNIELFEIIIEEQQTIGVIKPSKGGTGQTQTSQDQGNTGSDNSQNTPNTA